MEEIAGKNSNIYYSLSNSINKRSVGFKQSVVDKEKKLSDDVYRIQNNMEQSGKDGKLYKFKLKHFRIQPSPLSPLLSETAFGTVPNIFLAVFLLMTMKAMIEDLITTGNPFNHLWLIVWNFKYFPETMFIWFFMSLSVLIPYYGLKLWSNRPSQKVKLDCETVGLILCYLFYLSIFFYLPLRFVFRMQLNCACTFIITCESTRIAMKVHSFVRENIYRVIRIKETLYSSHAKMNDPCQGTLREETDNPLDQDKNNELNLKEETGADLLFPTVQQLYYYFFCPAFLYRDNYPRTESVNWNLVLNYFLQIIIVILFVNLVFTQIIYPNSYNVDYSRRSFGEIIVSTFASLLPGFLCLISLFYGLLHCWLNMFAEMLRFGDRGFYLNWWTSRNMAEYYRNWNLVVHDWLYAYVYRDIALLTNSKNGLKFAQIMVFFSSAFFHEYWFGVALRLFYPVMFVLYFIFGGIFLFISKFIKNQRIWNTIMWTNLIFGTGVFVALYSQEWYARIRCPHTSNSAFIDLIKPRHWFCNEQLENTF